MADCFGKSPIQNLNGYQTIWNGTYYHPILFLKTIALISDEFYIKMFCIVFGESDNRNISDIDQVEKLPIESIPSSISQDRIN